ncbi:MAG: insulinase family protein [Candidatus Eisenbacteria sp.]|nr:insulinase family protein [Candidatus Eisenbacteria bacterium]
MKMKGLAVRAGATAVAGLLILGVSAGSALAEPFDHPRDLKYAELNEIRTPEIERYALDNNMVVYLLEDHEFPMVDFQVLVRVGEMYEPIELRGLARMAGTVLRTGGTTTIPGDELDVKLESMGAVLESSIGGTEGRVSGSFLSQDTIEGLGLLADLCRNPAFPDEKIDLAKVGARTAISSRNDEPVPIAIREFRALIYGEDSPYGWYPEYETIAAITRDDLVRFHDSFFLPDRMILTVFGDFDRGEMRAEIERVFGEWPPNGKPLPPDPPVPQAGPKGIYYAHKSGVTQSTVLFGLMGFLASDPDYAAMQLLNQILGSGFSSRLVNEIRTERGLAYAVGSAAGDGWHHPGAWVCYLLTQSDSTIVATGAMRRQVERIVTEPVTEDELTMAKEIVLNELVFDLSSKRDVLRRKAFYEYHGYPADFLERYQQKVRTLTAENLLVAAQRHIHPEEIATVVVGVREDFAQPLESLGEVTEIDITVPDPPSQLVIPEPTAAALAQGREILAAAAEAHGGAALAAVRSVHTKGAGTLSMMGNAMSISVEAVRVAPERSWQKINIGGFAEIVEVIDGDHGWSQSPQGIQEQSGDDLAEQKQQFLRQPEYLLTHLDEMTWQALEPREIEGVTCAAVHVRDVPIKEWVLYFHPDSHLLYAMEYRGRGPQGPAKMETTYADFRTVAGVKLPFATVLRLDGEEFTTMQAESIEINAPVDEALFKKPE